MTTTNVVSATTEPGHPSIDPRAWKQVVARGIQLDEEKIEILGQLSAEDQLTLVCRVGLSIPFEEALGQVRGGANEEETAREAKSEGSENNDGTLADSNPLAEQSVTDEKEREPKDSWDCPFHPAANIFPMMSEPELAGLAENIKKDGLGNSIVMVGEAVLDGRNRLAACKLAGEEPHFVQWDGKGSPVDYVLSQNLHRRHLNDQQRALVAANVKRYLEKEGNARRLENLKQNMGPTEDLDPGHRKNRGTGRSAAKAAAQLNVSKDSVEKASRVLKKGDESLVRATREGNVSLDAAATVAKLPKDRQRELVKDDRVKEVAKEIRSEKKKPAVAAAGHEQVRSYAKPEGVPEESINAAADKGEESEATLRPWELLDNDDDPSDPAGTDTAASEGVETEVNAATTSAEANSSTTESSDPSADTPSPASEPNQQPKLPSTKVALAILLRFVEKKGTTVARTIINKVAEQADLEIWIDEDELGQSLDDLKSLLTTRVCTLAENDHRAAEDWINWHIETLWATFRESAPEEDGDSIANDEINYEAAECDSGIVANPFKGL